MMIEMAELYRIDGMEVARLQAQTAASFPRHTHAEYVIGVNLAGCEQIWLDGREFTAQAHSVTIYNPEAVQSSIFFDTAAGGADFVSVYIEPQRLAQAVAENGWRSRAIAPEIAQGVFEDAQLRQAILQLYRAARNPQQHDLDTAWVTLSAALLGNGGAEAVSAVHPLDTGMLLRVLELMRAHLDQPIAWSNWPPAAALANII